MELSYETFCELVKRRFGVMSPTGEVFPCDMYNHVEVFIDQFNDPEINSQIEQLTDESEADLEQALQDKYDWMNENPDEHPEWHHYEMYADDEKYSLKNRIKALVVNKAYSLGWARIGMTKKYVEFEGKEYFKNDIRFHGQQIAEMLNLEYRETFVQRDYDERDFNK
jgi:hypothetical protein